MSVEALKFKLYSEEGKTREILRTENIENHLCAISEELFKDELEVGRGNFSKVYQDTEAGLVYKKEKPFVIPKNTVHEEAEYLTELYNMSDDVIVPMPIASVVANMVRDKDGRKLKQSVLVMQKINGYSLDKILSDPEQGKEKLVFPETFNVDVFFEALRSFIIRMHHEKGIYHRDLYDRNIMVDIKTGKPALIDFGEAARFSESFAEEGEYDAYGQKVLKDDHGNFIKRKDFDLENLENLELQVRRYLTNLSNRV